MQSHLISIIVPIYNVAEYLPKCIDSIVDQTYDNLDIILVNDGSTDDSLAICRQYAKRDNRIHIINKSNQGLFAARRDGCLDARGDFIGFVDSDDWIEPNMFEKLLKSCVENNTDVSICGVYDNMGYYEKARSLFFDAGVYRDSEFEKKILPQMIFTGAFYQYGINPYLWDKLFKRNVILPYQCVDVNEGMEIINDATVSWPAILEAGNISIISDNLYHYRVRNNSKKRNKADEFSEVAYKYYSYWLELLAVKKYSNHFNVIEKQFRWYVIYNIVAKTPGFFDDIEKDEYLLAYGGIPEGSKIVVYGAGMVGINLVRYIGNINKLQVVLWIDKKWDLFEKWLGIKDPKEVLNVNYDYVIVAISRATMIKSACCDLNKIGVISRKIRILDMKMLERYYESFEQHIIKKNE